jgi:proline iminopeptidase
MPVAISGTRSATRNRRQAVFSVQPDALVPREGFVAVRHGALFYRQIGQGRPIIVLHGGPDFDHTYLLPDLDRLASAYRLIYYDQRGRGRSLGDPQAISLQTELEDLDDLRQHLQLDSVGVLGHSWGSVLAMEYALGHPERVSHLILMNTAPASQAGLVLLRQEIASRLAAHQQRMKELKSSLKYLEGDPATAAEYYRYWFSAAFKRPEHLNRLDLGFTHLTPEDVRRARAVEQRLYQDTFDRQDFNLIPRLRRLRVPTLVIHGDYDFVPAAVAAGIAQAIPGARLAVLNDCGHFAYFECPEGVRQAVANFV